MRRRVPPSLHPKCEALCPMSSWSRCACVSTLIVRIRRVGWVKGKRSGAPAATAVVPERVLSLLDAVGA